MDKSPFQKLPPELRNRIYGDVLAQPKPIVLTRVWDDWEMFRIKAPAPQQLLALTKTCKAINGESQQLFYTINTFRLKSSIDRLFGAQRA